MCSIPGQLIHLYRCRIASRSLWSALSCARRSLAPPGTSTTTSGSTVFAHKRATSPPANRTRGWTSIVPEHVDQPAHRRHLLLTVLTGIDFLYERRRLIVLSLNVCLLCAGPRVTKPAGPALARSNFILLGKRNDLSVSAATTIVMPFLSSPPAPSFSCTSPLVRSKSCFLFQARNFSSPLSFSYST